MVDQPFFLPAAIIGVLEIPLILGLVPRNRLYGVRTSKTLADDHAWYPANRVGGPLVLSLLIIRNDLRQR